MSGRSLEVTDRSRVRRHGERGSHELELIYSILDEARICHVAWCDDGRAMILPTAFGRMGNDVILHGAANGRFMQVLSSGCEVCIEVTLVDGLVLAKSAFHSSMNYRSVILFGRAEPVSIPTDKMRALDALVEHLIPGRGSEVRDTTEAELSATRVVRVPIIEASAKVRVGPPKDPTEDLSLPVWSGVVPLSAQAESPIPDIGSEDRPLPGSVLSLRVAGRRSGS